jgi:hypothetical protein
MPELGIASLAYAVLRREAAKTTVTATGGATKTLEDWMVQLDTGIVATGGTLKRTLADRFGNLISAKDFGAVGDGTTDDTAALNSFFAAIRSSITTSYLPSGTAAVIGHLDPGATYKVTDTINATGIKAANWVLDGNGAVILGRSTGKPVIDLLGSRWFTLRDFAIDGGATDRPTFGIQMGRISSSAVGEANLENIHIEGHFTNACLYDLASETTQFRHTRFYNDYNSATAYCLIADARNEQNIASAFVTQTISQGSAQSFNERLYLGCDFRKAQTGPLIRLIGNFNRHKFINCYGAGVGGAAIEIYKSTHIRQLDLDIHLETTGLDYSLLIDTTDAGSNVVIRGLRLQDHNPHADTAVINTTGNTRTLVIYGADIDIGTLQNAVPLFGTGSGAANLIQVSGDIKWGATQNLDLRNCYFDGTIYATEAAAIDHTPGTYEIVRLPNSTDNRTREIKGRLRVSGTVDSGSTPANAVQIEGALTGGVPSVTAVGSDTDVDLLLAGQGAGAIRVGTHSALGAETVTGYITIKDAGGTARKIAVVS